MGGPTAKAEALRTVLHQELEKLIRECPEFGSLVLRAEVHDGAIGRVSLGIETTRKLAARPEREER